MRLFVAVPLGEPARGEILRLLGTLRGTGWPVRWVGDEVVHITVKFFGEVPDERLDVIAEALRLAAAPTGPLTLTVDGLGAFPTMRRPRILRVGFAPNAELAALRDRFENACDAIGFAREGIPFEPHVTLGRVREGQRLPLQGLETYARTVAPRAFDARDVVLYESILTAAGPRYETRYSVGLSG